jgi:hypothetical protein
VAGARVYANPDTGYAVRVNYSTDNGRRDTVEFDW